MFFDEIEEGAEGANKIIPLVVEDLKLKNLSCLGLPTGKISVLL